jgi:hypothetical protein
MILQPPFRSYKPLAKSMVTPDQVHGLIYSVVQKKSIQYKLMLVAFADKRLDKYTAELGSSWLKCFNSHCCTSISLHAIESMDWSTSGSNGWDIFAGTQFKYHNCGIR